VGTYVENLVAITIVRQTDVLRNPDQRPSLMCIRYRNTVMPGLVIVCVFGKARRKCTAEPYPDIRAPFAATQLQTFIHLMLSELIQDLGSHRQTALVRRSPTRLSQGTAVKS